MKGSDACNNYQDARLSQLVIIMALVLLFLSAQFPVLLPGSSAPARDKAALSLSVLKSSLQRLDANLTDHQQLLSWSGKDRYREKRLGEIAKEGWEVAWRVMTGPFGIR